MNDAYLFPQVEDPYIPEVGDRVRVYSDRDAEYYIEGEIVSLDDNVGELYTVRFRTRRDGELTSVTVPYHRLEPVITLENKSELSGS